ncbi:MAG: thiosulfate oxidation carrier protein SoxY [Betaproteobacteria bacterium]|nr:thiosulfate oxidation carrier protein SoxY [Betaproteobacteria bacterium]
MRITRRSLLKLLATLANWPFVTFAAQTTAAAAFGEHNATDALRDLNASRAAASTDIVLRIPANAEDRLVVPLEITSDLPDTRAIDILVEQNPWPLAATFRFSNGALPFIATHLRIGQDSDVIAVAHCTDGTYTTHKAVHLTSGGCAS